MQRLTLITLSICALAALVLMQPVLAGDMGNKTEGKMQIMVGMINQDARFETADGSEYLIVGDKAEDVIIKQGEKVKITGSLRTEGDTKAIAVQEFKVLDDYEFQKEMEKQKSKGMDQ